MTRPTVAMTLAVALAMMTFGLTSIGRSAADEAQWTAERGGFGDVEDLAVLSETDAWAVGSGIAHYDGRSWRATNTESYFLGLKAIELVSATDGWVVGWEKVIPFVGGTWQPAVSLPDVLLLDVDLWSMTSGWAVGERRGKLNGGGAIFRLEGSEWLEVEVPAVPRLTGVWSSTADEAWAVGMLGTMLHFHNGAWSQVPSPVDDTLLAVAGTGPDDVWAVGGQDDDCYTSNDDRHRVMLHYDGNGWSVARSEEACALHDIVFRDVVGWAVGGRGERMHYDGKTWTELSRMDPNEGIVPFSAVQFVPNSSAALSANNWGRIVRMDGDTVVDLHAALSYNSEYSGILVLNDSDGWAVGPGVPPLRFDGAAWQRADAPQIKNMNDVDGHVSDDLWAVGPFGRIAHFDGRAWDEVSSPTDVHLRAVKVTSGGNGWAVGSRAPIVRGDPIRGIVLRLKDGVWQTLGQIPGQLLAIEVVTSDDIWVTSYDAHWHFDGTEWRKGDPGGGAIDMVSPTLGWMGGAGSIYRYDGTEWSQEWAFPAGAQVGNLMMNGDGTGWAVAWYGMVAYRDGAAWRLIRGRNNPQPSDGVPNGLLDLAVVRNGTDVDLWAAGGAETILHGRHRPDIVPTANGPIATMTPAATALPSPTPGAAEILLPNVVRDG